MARELLKIIILLGKEGEVILETFDPSIKITVNGYWPEHVRKPIDGVEFHQYSKAGQPAEE